MRFVILILIGVLGAGAYAYLYEYRPMAREYSMLKAGRPGMEQELRRYQERERQERDWSVPLAGMLQNGLAAQVAAGTAEVLVGGGRIVVHIAEDVLYTPQSVTFAKDSRPFQLLLAGLLKEFKDKDVFVGNTTQPAPAQGRGRRRVPAKDGRTLASARSHELVKALIRNGVPGERIIEAAFSANVPEQGRGIKGGKTVIVISSPTPAASLAAPPSAPVAAPSGTAAPGPPSGLQKPIPITPARR